MGFPARFTSRRLPNFRRYMALSRSSIWLFPMESTFRSVRLSRPSMTFMRLFRRDRSVIFVSRSRPSILAMLLNDRSSRVRFTRWSRFSIFSITLLSSWSLVRFAKPSRLSIFMMFWKLKIAASISAKGIVHRLSSVPSSCPSTCRGGSERPVRDRPRRAH